MSQKEKILEYIQGMTDERLYEVFNMRWGIWSVIQMASYRQFKNVNNGTDFANDITGSGKL